MTQPITPPIEPMSEPQRLSRQDILNEYWPEFLSIQLREYEKRKASGWGVSKGLFTESEFWEFMVTQHRDIIDKVVEDGE